MASPLDRIAGFSAQITTVEAQMDQVTAEISMLEHIDDDAQRDAAVTGNYEDASDARMTSGDVSRMRKQLVMLQATRVKLVRKRAKAIRKLAAR